MNFPKIDRAKRETAINTIAISLTAAGAVNLQNGKIYLGIILIGVGALLEYFKYSLRYLGNKIK